MLPLTARIGFFKLPSAVMTLFEPMSPACQISSHGAQWSRISSSMKPCVSDKSAILVLTAVILARRTSYGQSSAVIVSGSG